MIKLLSSKEIEVLAAWREASETASCRVCRVCASCGISESEESKKQDINDGTRKEGLN